MSVRKLTGPLILLWLTVLAVVSTATACATEPQTPTIPSTPPMPTPNGTAEATSTPAEGSGQPISAEQIAEAVARRRKGL